jgi:hypothetical protein
VILAALPQHMAVSLRLTVALTKILRGYASASTLEAEPPLKAITAPGKPEAFRYVLRRSRLTPSHSHGISPHYTLTDHLA